MNDERDSGGVTIVGRAIPALWYVYADGVYSFHTALYADGEAVVFRVNNRTWPSSVLNGERANYTLLRNATQVEVDGWHKENNYLEDNLPVRLEV